MVAATSPRRLLPAAIKRLPWMRRIEFYSPKAGRRVVLFSYDAVSVWALAESCPLVEAFCEYPGFIPVDGERVVADFWVRGADREQFIRIERGIALSPEFPKQVQTYADTEVAVISTDWLAQREVWIDNWLQINPYLVANARFVSAATLDRVNALFDSPRPLFDVEHAVRDVDAQLVRTAVFMLMHQGKLHSDDLVVRPLAITTVFRRNSASSTGSGTWPD